MTKRKMRFHILIDDENSTHTHFTVFVNGASAGTLVLRNDEFTVFTNILSLGKREHEFKVTSQPKLPSFT